MEVDVRAVGESKRYWQLGMGLFGAGTDTETHRKRRPCGDRFVSGLINPESDTAATDLWVRRLLTTILAGARRLLP
ncbi:hypothetical protein GCM10011348_31600 [Marinobacterium nitratireducens]|uniref:Uncharacterized protein n=1 Tax=Marinobacterium nitratireducens TaxID=518897 RepID=A0A917ZLM0_9GAMM|nr:hypothetical protein GCM10011348_31600 [Marinobacterium nitratireducens]